MCEITNKLAQLADSLTTRPCLTTFWCRLLLSHAGPEYSQKAIPVTSRYAAFSSLEPQPTQMRVYIGDVRIEQDHKEEDEGM